MCQQSVTLQTAVLMQVKEFVTSNTTFSVHDITRAIRSKLYNDELEIPEVKVDGAVFRSDIPHTKVKAIFNELWHTGVFDPDFTLGRNFNGMYFEYTPSLLNPTVKTTTPITAPVTQTMSTSAPVASASTIISSLSTFDSVVQDRIETYLDNCIFRNTRPAHTTLRNVQSAIKRDVSTGWSCEKIREYIECLGYTVVDDQGSISKAWVLFV
jgi:hypothetical protein